MSQDLFRRFSGIEFEDFRRMARNPSLWLSEKVPATYTLLVTRGARPAHSNA